MIGLNSNKKRKLTDLFCTTRGSDNNTTHIVQILALDTHQNIAIVFIMLSGESLEAHWASCSYL